MKSMLNWSPLVHGVADCFKILNIKTNLQVHSIKQISVCQRFKFHFFFYKYNWIFFFRFALMDLMILPVMPGILFIVLIILHVSFKQWIVISRLYQNVYQILPLPSPFNKTTNKTTDCNRIYAWYLDVLLIGCLN